MDKNVLVGCLTAIIMFATLMTGMVSSTINENTNITERVKIVCHGDLVNDATRSNACTLALQSTAHPH